MSSDQADLQNDVADKLTLAESSHPEEAMREPIEHWLFDPTEAPGYVAVLRGLLGAAGAHDRPDALHISPAGCRSDYGHETDKESAYSQACPRHGGARNRGRDVDFASPYRIGPSALGGLRRHPTQPPKRRHTRPREVPAQSGRSSHRVRARRVHRTTSMDDQLPRLPPIQRKDTAVRLCIQTRINITRWAEEYISGLVENHNGDSEDICLIIHDLHYQATFIDQTTCRSRVADLYPTWIHSHPAQNGSP